MGTLQLKSSVHTELWLAHTDLSLSGAVHTAMPLASALSEAGPWVPCNSEAAYTPMSVCVKHTCLFSWPAPGIEGDPLVPA